MVGWMLQWHTQDQVYQVPTQAMAEMVPTVVLSQQVTGLQQAVIQTHHSLLHWDQKMQPMPLATMCW